MPTEVADALRARAGELGVSVGETVARLLGVGGPLPQPAQPTVDLLVNERTQRPAAPPASSQATARGGPRCRCKVPTMSKVVTNVCTSCRLIRRP